ncbi:MAG TPA: nucleoside hydrolase [Candidatus Saccharimonadales bacterium]|nr:nucleoside hydrolase [Candidatus Saccharimonadales bacterium]
MKHPAVLFLDNTSWDNMALALAATRPSSLLDVKAIFVTGRAAHTDPNASVEERDENYSSYIHFLNAARLQQFLQNAGRADIPVIMGERVHRTQIRTVIPHRAHVNEEVYDLWDAWGEARIHEFTEGIQFLRHHKAKKFLVLVGGPLTEVALIQRYAPDVAAKFGTIFVQAGDFADDESTNLLGGKGNSFNGAVDAVALDDVLRGHDGEVILLPSNMTKQSELGFATPDQLAGLGIYPPLLEGYRVHYEHSAKRRGTSLFIHDLGLVILAEQRVRGHQDFPYRYEQVGILEVPFGAPLSGQPERRGTIVIGPPVCRTNRYVVVWQDTDGYRDRVAAYLQS